MTQTVRSAVEKRQGGEVDRETAAIEKVKDQVRQNRRWFGTVVPKHIDPDQFVALCLGAISKGDQWVKLALAQNPHTFLQSASECARLGLVPGETYWFVAFKNGKSGTYEITGIVDYKGEIDLIYRAGGVVGVHCHVVREHDTFRWRPGEMNVPYHVIHAPDGSAQEGLASVEERGHITGVYAYCTMANGGYSQPTVMGLSEIKRHRSFAKTEKFWGPVEGLYDVAREGQHTVDMVRKTAIHKQFDMVPHSSEYLAEKMRVTATVEANPMPALASAPRPAIAGTTESGDDAAPVRPPGEESAAGEEPRSAAEDAYRAAVNRLGFLFKQYGLDGKNLADTRRAVVTGLLGADRLVNLDELASSDIKQACDLLEEQFGVLSSRTDELKRYAQRTAAAIMQKEGA
jgi:recombination protein RecT